MHPTPDGQDLGDRLQLHSLVEDPERWERAILEETERAKNDPAARELLRAIFCDSDRSEAFERYRQSDEFRAIVRVFDLIGVMPSARGCEIGGGAGWLGWALHKERGQQIHLLEPNEQWVSGTGYIRTREDASSIKIFKDIDAWYSMSDRYDFVLTHNCVHHFHGLARVAAEIRSKLKNDGYWIMIREAFADDALALYQRMAEHPYSQRYGLYEFFYPASHYVEALRLVGFELHTVVPSGYASNIMNGGARVAARSFTNRLGDAAVELLLQRSPRVLSTLYELEFLANRYLGASKRRFTWPQVMVFRRTAVVA